MIFSFYTSTEDYCDESYVLEQEVASPLVFLYCEDCNKKHEFFLKVSLYSAEELWKYIKSLGFDDETY